MGEYLGAWRARIGLFLGRLRTVKVNNFSGTSGSCTVALFLAFLLLIGGVEPNPGPTLDDIYTLMQKSKETMEQGFKDVHEKINGLEKGLREKLDMQEEKISLLEEENNRLKESIRKIEEKQDELENRSRRNNLIFHGIEESTNSNETWSDCASKIIDIIKNDMKVEGISENDVERAHRLGSIRGKRPIIVKFSHFGVKDKIIFARKNLKGSNIFINEDYSKKVRQERDVLISEMKAAREKGDTATVIFNKLKVNGKLYKYSWEEDRILELPRRQQSQEGAEEVVPQQEIPRILTRQEKKKRKEETPGKYFGGGGIDGWLQTSLRKESSSSTRGRGGGRGGSGGK